MTKYLLLSLIIAYSVISSCTSESGATSAPISALASVTIGSVLDDLSNRISQVISHAQTAGLILEVNAGSQVLAAIQSTKEAYKEELNRTVGALDAKQQQVFPQLDGLIRNVQGGITDLSLNVQQIVLSLPGANNYPQVTHIEGTIIDTDDDEKMSVTLKGVFFYASEEGYKPTIKVGNKAYKALVCGTQDLCFSVPKDKLYGPRKKLIYKEFTVEIPYNYKKFYIFNERRVASYSFNFIILPETFGSYELLTTSIVDTTLSQITTCPNLVWDTHNNQDDDNSRGCPVTPGWFIDVPTVTTTNPRNISGTEGRDWYNRGSISVPSYAGWHFYATQKHGWFGNYGAVTVDLSYREYKFATKPKTVLTASGDLGWNTEKVLQIPPSSTWKLIVHQFNGKTKEIASDRQDSPYFHAKTISNHIELTTAPFK